MASLDHCPSSTVQFVHGEHHADGHVSYPDLKCPGCDHPCGGDGTAQGFDPTCGMASAPGSRFHVLVDVPEQVTLQQAEALRARCERLQQQPIGDVMALLGDLTELLIGPFATESAMHDTCDQLAATGIGARPHIH